MFGRVFSDGFLSLLRPKEKERLEFRPLLVSGKQPRRKYFELLTPPEVPFVGVNGFDTAGYECLDCGCRVFSTRERVLNQSGFYINHFVCRSDLPDPLPSCFVVRTTEAGKEQAAFAGRFAGQSLDFHDHLRGKKFGACPVAVGFPARPTAPDKTSFSTC